MGAEFNGKSVKITLYGSFKSKFTASKNIGNEQKSFVQAESGGECRLKSQRREIKSRSNKIMNSNFEAGLRAIRAN